MSNLAKEVLFPGVVVLGANATIQLLATGSVKGTPVPGFQTADALSLAGQAIASGLTWMLAGPLPAILGILETTVFLGLKLIPTEPAPVVPFKPATSTMGPVDKITDSLPGFAKVAKYAPAVDAFFKKVGIAGVVTQQMN